MLITLRVIDGLEAGETFEALKAPFTIGREEGNRVQLNDERVSRYHAKIQSDQDRVFITDLESTNGTRVNGHPVRMHVLQSGDQIAVGRCLLVFIHEDDAADSAEIVQQAESVAACEEDDDVSMPLFPAGPPTTPSGLSAIQAAMISDILDWARTEVLGVLRSIEADPPKSKPSEAANQPVRLSRENLLRLQAVPEQISRYLERIADPGEE